MIALIIIAAVPALFLLWVLTTYVEHVISLRKYPKGPFPLPLIGNLNLIGGQRIHLNLLELTKKYGNVYSISMGMRRVVVVNSYENVKEGLVTRGHDLAGRPHLRVGSKYHSNNYKTVGAMDYSKSWAFVRKLAYKSLHLYGEGMVNMESCVLENVEKLSGIISKEVGQPVLIHQYLGNILVNTICTRVFNTDYEIDDPEFQNILDFTFDIGKGLGLDGWTMIFPWLANLPANTSEELRHLIAAVKNRNAHTRKKFEEHIATFNPEKLRDICDQLLFLSQNKEQWEGAGFEKVTQEQLEAIVHSYFFAGIETTLTTLRWFFLYCLYHPEYETKMYQELVDTFGLKHRLTYGDLSSLPFTQAMMNETNRCASILRINLPHKAEVDSSIGGKAIPKGTPVIFNFHSVHFDGKYWENPNEFNPHRWLNTDGSLKKEKVTHYLPFSAGTRVCLGEKMAKVQMFLIAASLVRSFEVMRYDGEKLPALDERGPGSGPYTPGTTYKVIFKKRSEA